MLAGRKQLYQLVSGFKLYSISKELKVAQGYQQGAVHGNVWQAAAFGLKSLNIPDEVIASIETEDDLMEVLGKENNVEEDIIEQEVLPTDDEIQLVSVPTD